MRNYIGIDNGVSGSIGILTNINRIFTKMPTISELDYTKEKKNITRVNVDKLYDLLLPFSENDSFIAMERPMVNPGRWVATSSALRCHEATLVVIQMLGIPYMFIDSKEWQKLLLPSGCQKEELKKASLDVGNRLFPCLSHVNHPDRDGILIAEYCKRKGL